MANMEVKSKEEILKAIHAKRVVNFEKVFIQNPSIIESAYDAMEFYANQEKRIESIEFGQWVRETSTTGLYKTMTIEQLYDLFNQNKNNNK